jgi:hypothetical protein
LALWKLQIYDLLCDECDTTLFAGTARTKNILPIPPLVALPFGSMSLFLETKDNREQRHTVEEIEMTPENKQAVEKHVQEIAKILYGDADKSRMTNLAEIEVVIREQVQEHVSPQIGVFLSQA